MLIKGWTFKESADEVRELVGDLEPAAIKPKPERDMRPKLKEIWGRSKRVEVGDPVQKYLANRCGWPTIPPSIRTVMDLEHRASDGTITRHPAMVARVTDQYGDGVALHRTYLTPDGFKAGVEPVRMAIGKLPDGCAVRLAGACSDA